MTITNKEIVLYPSQIEPSKWLFDKFKSNQNGLLSSPVGTGKTIIALKAIKELHQYEESYGLKKSKVLVIPTKKGILFWRSKAIEYDVDIDIISQESLRTKNGCIYITYESKEVYGRITLVPIWEPCNIPDIVIFDECQKIKNESSIITEIQEAYINQGGHIYLMSATAFALFDETYITCLAAKLCRNTVDWKRNILSFYLQYRDPHEPHPVIMKRFCDDLVAHNFLYKVKSVKFKKKGYIKCKPLPFENEKKAIIYSKAYAMYEAACIAAGKLPPREARLAIWVANQQYWKMSEYLISDLLAKLGYEESFKDNGYQIGFGFNYRPSLLKCFKTLIKLGVNQNQISTIIGGQDDMTRNIEIAKFQKGITKFVLVMLKAGGDTLTLSHNIDNGYTRPRKCYFGPCWSIIDLVQFGGRMHRIDSISTTWQYAVYYTGTILDKIMSRVANKSCSLAALVGTKVSMASSLAPDYVNRMRDKIYEEEEEQKELENDENIDTFEIRDDEENIEDNNDNVIDIEGRQIIGEQKQLTNG